MKLKSLLKKFILFENEYRDDGKYKVIKFFGFYHSFYKGYNIQGVNNKIYIEKDGKVEECRGVVEGLEVKIVGNNNNIVLGFPYKFVNSKIYCSGNSNTIMIEKTKHCIYNSYFDLWSRMLDKRFIHIKENVSMAGVNLHAYSNTGDIIIGKDCMFSWEIEIMNGDGHKIRELNNDKILNNGKSVLKIGNHVWVGQKSTVCKNTQIADNCIIGAASVVTKSIQESDSVAAGNPARIVKRNISWSRESECDA